MISTLFWLILGICAFALDVFTSSFLFVWFTGGALAAIVANLFGASFVVQIIVFALGSLVSIGIGYPWAKKKFKETQVKTPLMEETYIGNTYITQEDIEEEGRAKVGGIYWTVKNKGFKINKGEKFKIISIEGNKFIIEGLREE